MSARFETYFHSRGFTPFHFQRDVWKSMAAGSSGLLHAPTGMGKTLAVWLGAIAASETTRKNKLKILWLTPLRALAHDTLAALQEPLGELDLDFEVAARTGDTSSHIKKKQEQHPPQAMVTTPESLTLLLTRKNSRKYFQSLQVVIVDEWHELLGSKRGVQTELALARLRKFSPSLITWGVSATLANLAEAKLHLLGLTQDGEENSGVLVSGDVPKEIAIDSLLPASTERFPWAGHLGLKMVPQVVAELEEAETALVFTNTRAQCELWHQALSAARPDWPIGLHHGSLAREEREMVEAALKRGEIKVVVCTSSLDLGVDFSPVERVLQIGSPKGIARLLQRAGRSGHGPGRSSRVTCVPVHALELVEAAAARDASLAGEIEGRPPYFAPLDVLAQHLVSMGLGQGFRQNDMLTEIRTTGSYRHLSEEEYLWLLDFLTTGGRSLSAYQEYKKLIVNSDTYTVEDKTIAKRHRMAIGTIVSDTSIRIRYLKGPVLGSVEESFIARLKPGETFLFAGKALELARVNNLTAYVRKASVAGAVPVWQGGRMPLSTQLSLAVRRRLDSAARGEYHGHEMVAVRPILELQEKWSALPRLEDLLVEQLKTREGYHLYLYPFAGRLVHEGLAALLAMRLARMKPITFSWSVNDYGLELLASAEPPFSRAVEEGLFARERLAEDIIESLNAAELAKSRFREIARIAGLVFEGYPGKSKTARQIQATSSLLFDVFSKYDPENPLLQQSHFEVYERQLERSRLHSTLEQLNSSELLLRFPEKVTPLGFPLLVDRLREKLSTEKLQDRIERMVTNLEKHANKRKAEK